ncbi:MAG: sulfatase-like hydrolase/transferase [Candidatus Coatesbacteria bacterium]|nr:sulfatase-like hydrolase/transferase [Candidatus Coatesbacteria bacterium]
MLKNMNKWSLFLSALISLFLAVILILLGVKSFNPVEKKYNLMVINIENLSTDYMSIYGYQGKTSPAIDKLTDKSFVFNKAFTSSIERESVLGRISEYAGIEPGKMGYRTLCCCNKKDYSIFDKKFSSIISSSRKDIYNDKELVEKMVTHINELDKKNWSILVNLSSMNLPFKTNMTSYRQFNEIPPLMLGIKPYWEDDSTINEHIYDNMKTGFGISPKEWESMRFAYAAQLSSIDSLIDKILVVLKKKNLLDKTIIVIFSSKGFSLGEHYGYFGEDSFYNETLRIPFIIYHPHGKKALVDKYFRIDELFALCSNLLKQKEGRKVTEKYFSANSGKILVTDKDSNYAYIDTRYKLITIWGGKPVLYNLVDDFSELYDIANNEPKTVSRMQKEALEMLKGEKDQPE